MTCSWPSIDASDSAPTWTPTTSLWRTWLWTPNAKSGRGRRGGEGTIPTVPRTVSLDTLAQHRGSSKHRDPRVLPYRHQGHPGRRRLRGRTPRSRTPQASRLHKRRPRGGLDLWIAERPEHECGYWGGECGDLNDFQARRPCSKWVSESAARTMMSILGLAPNDQMPANTIVRHAVRNPVKSGSRTAPSVDSRLRRRSAGAPAWCG